MHTTSNPKPTQPTTHNGPQQVRAPSRNLQTQPSITNPRPSSLAFLLNPLPGSIQTFTKDGIRYQAIETNGRHYHAWKAGKYPFPCDLTARDSNNILNGLIYLHCYKAGGLGMDAALNEVVMGPLVEFVEGPPRRILDLGCGTGIWVSDTARRFRGAMVIFMFGFNGVLVWE